MIHRFGWGEVQALMQMKGGYISDCRLYSDALDTALFEDLEEALRGVKYDAAAIRGIALPQGISAHAYEVLEMIAESVPGA